MASINSAQTTSPPAALERVVITGVGVVSPLGNDPVRLVQALREGRSGIAPLTNVPQGVLAIDHGAQAWDFSGNIDDYGPLEKTQKRNIRKGSKVMCREIEMGVAAAQLALHDAGFSADGFDRDRTGVVFGCDYIMSLPEEYAEGIAACTVESNFDFTRWGENGLPKINPLWLLKYLPNMPASHVAIYNDLRGPNNSITLREASAGAAIAESVSTIQRGHADAIVVGSTGSRIHTLRTLHAALQEKLAANRDDPATMSRPFDTSRDGAVVGEGAGSLMLESWSHASKRGANILGEVVGYGSSAVGNAPGRDAARTALANVLKQSRRTLGTSQSPGHIHAHGLGTPECDQSEALAIADVFGDASKQPPVTTAKGHIGNLGAGGGMVEIIASLMALGGDLFAIRNLDALDSQCPIAAVSSNGTPAGDSFISANVTPQGQASAVWIAAA